MKFKFIEEHRSVYGVEKMCRALDVSRSGYYAWRKCSESMRKKEDENLLQNICRIYHASQDTYGSIRVSRQLKAEGYGCGKNRVARLMRKAGIYSKTPRKFKVTTNSRHNYPVAQNLLNQNFTVLRPNQVWVADITYIWTQEGWLYLATVLDLYSRKIVGWAMDKTMTHELVANALNQAIGRRRPPKGLIHHSDRGCQYACHAYQQLLKEHGFIPSMSRKGNCYDNACMESFFHTLKTEHVYRFNFRTRIEARQSIFWYIEIFYNRVRLHSYLDYKSPENYERGSLAA